MAKSNRSTASTRKFNPANLSREGRAMHEAIKLLSKLPTAVPEPPLAFLPRTYRLRLADLAAATNVAPEKYIRRAMDLFFEIEAPVYANR